MRCSPTTLTIRATVHRGDLPQVEGDEVQLAQLFQNLLTNALKFARKDVPPVITIPCEPSDLVLLDIVLPRKNGLEVLAEIKGDPALRRIPVIMLTTSKAEEDILRSYDLHANSY